MIDLRRRESLWSIDAASVKPRSSGPGVMHACGVCSDRALVTGSVVELPLPAGVWVVLARRSVTVLWYVSPPSSVPVV